MMHFFRINFCVHWRARRSLIFEMISEHSTNDHYLFVFKRRIDLSFSIVDHLRFVFNDWIHRYSSHLNGNDSKNTVKHLIIVLDFILDRMINLINRHQNTFSQRQLSSVNDYKFHESKHRRKMPFYSSDLINNQIFCSSSFRICFWWKNDRWDGHTCVFSNIM